MHGMCAKKPLLHGHVWWLLAGCMAMCGGMLQNAVVLCLPAHRPPLDPPLLPQVCVMNGR